MTPLDLPATAIVNRPQTVDALSDFELHGGAGETVLANAAEGLSLAYPCEPRMIVTESIDDLWWQDSNATEEIGPSAKVDDYLRRLLSQRRGNAFAMRPLVKVAQPVGDAVGQAAGEARSSERALAGTLVNAIVNGGEDVALLVRGLTEARNPAAIDALRDGIARLADAFEQVARNLSGERLREQAADHSKQDVRTILQRIATGYGLSWHTIATMLGLTPTAVRKWRGGGSITPENREQVSALAAFFDRLDELQIADLGSWIEMRVHEETTLTPAEIYRCGPDARWLLLEWAGERIDAITMLDRFDSRWRETYARDPNFRVLQAPDGERAIVPR